METKYTLQLIIGTVLIVVCCLGQALSFAETTKSYRVVILTSRQTQPHREAASWIVTTLRSQPDLKIQLIKEYTLFGWKGKRAQLARQLIEDRPDIVFSLGTPAAIFSKEILPNRPMIFLLVLDPDYLVKSRVNLAGIGMDVPLERKIALFQKIIGRKKIGVLLRKENKQITHIEELARENSYLVIHSISRGEDLPSGLEILLNKGAEGLVMEPDPLLYGSVQAIRYTLLWGLRHKIPIMGLSRSFVENGALCALEPDYKMMGVMAANMGIGILCGDRSDEYAVEEPKSFILSINMRTARRLGVKVPKSVLLEAGTIIE